MGQRNTDARAVQTLDELAAFLRHLRSASGNMPFRRIQAEIREFHRAQSIPDGPPSLATVHGHFQNGRARMNPDTVLDIARALGLDAAGLRSLEQACHRVLDRANRSLIVATRAAVPAPTAAFTGRRIERDRIAALAEAAGPDGGAVVVVIEGMAGIGKTELAHRAALDLIDAGLVGDTRLFADLRGYDPLEPPAAAEAVIRGFLGHLGVPGRRIDTLSPAARVALLHRELAPRRALIVLDNAADEAQLEPLLPRAAGCVALVTSRRRLTGLQAVARVPLDVLSAREALEILRRRDPTGRLDAASEGAMALVELCRRLPLELTAVGRQLESKPDWSIGDHVERLRRIPPHEHSGPVLALSYDGLPDSAKRLFRLLAIHPGRRFAADDAAALAADPVTDVQAELTRLYDENLLLRRGEGHYEFHDSVRALATELAHREDPASRQHAAVGNLLRHYRRRLESSSDADAAWLSADRATLLACLHVADHDEAVAALAAPLNRGLRLLGHYDEARICNRQLLRIARRAGRLDWEADARAGLAEIDRLTGKFQAAAEGFGQVLHLRRRLGDPAGEADALRGLAQTASNDDYPLALERYRSALEIHRRLGNAVGEAEVLWGLAEIALSVGDHATAAAHATEVTSICNRIGNHIGEAYGLRALADVAAEQGDLGTAERRYRRSMAICERIGNRRGAAYALSGLAGAALRAGDLDRSERRYRRVLDGCRRIGDIAGEADALRGLAETALARGAFASAADGFARALPIYRETGDRVGEAHTLTGLGRAAWSSQRRARARRYWQEALILADRSGSPLASELRKLLESAASAGVS
ncbi:tetratricopeptide repeat protein [Glycomyces sp. TRM65418]|uniref:tetratricopeptide repeat protein n=1 Tax=Glycomyces sp. TRM65418 TaxID=2867006 RepID=UPI001CE6C943|nr:tetratricopeptide repeat protein [Glycomyces sp. TRM65418]MCC3765923.1 tetratricopeptide repeat protein [Glycomyces sp. TRM65418]QZD55505.1 tetratricopeptide repeat protein [Glycomyces sp. TRM65418]